MLAVLAGWLRLSLRLCDNIIMGECGHWTQWTVAGRPMWALIVFTLRSSKLYRLTAVSITLRCTPLLFIQILYFFNKHSDMVAIISIFISKIINGNKNSGKTIVELFLSFVWKPHKKFIINCKDMREYYNKYYTL